MNEALHLKLLGEQDQSQAPGLVWAFHAPAFSEPGELFALQDIRSALAAKDGGWIWLHVDLVDQRAPGWVGKICELPAASRAILEGYDFGLALGHEDGVVHGISADIHSELERKSNTVGLLHFAVTEHLLVTGRRHPLVSVEEVREGFAGGTLRPATAFQLFEAIVTAFGQNINQRLAEAATQLDMVEDHLVRGRPSDERRNLKRVRRLAVTLHRPISTLVALFRNEDRSDWKLPDTAHDVLPRVAAKLERLDRQLVMVSDRARLLQEELAAELAEESNRSLKALAVMSALLLPGTLVVGVFGMNTEGLPLTHTPDGFLIALLLCAAATGFFYWLLRRAGADLKL